MQMYLEISIVQLKSIYEINVQPTSYEEKKVKNERNF